MRKKYLRKFSFRKAKFNQLSLFLYLLMLKNIKWLVVEGLKIQIEQARILI